METQASPSLSVPGRPTYACIRCAERKVKCDRQRPCGTCVKHEVDCVFKPPRPPQKRHKRTQILTNRLKQYEILLQEQGIDPNKLPETPNSEPPSTSNHATAAAPKELQVQTPSSIESEYSRSINKSQVIHGQGRSKFLDNSLWSRVVEEFHDPEDALRDSSNDASGQEASEDEFSFVLGSKPMSNNMSRHPPPEYILQLWQLFVENVDPLTKIIHVPTLRPAVERAATNIASIPRSFEVLMFAIYAIAVMTLKDDECIQMFLQPRKALLSRYVSATKAALLRARFMGTTSLVVLQALVIHILCVRDIDEPRAVWSLTGVAVRIAQSMGLDRDGTSLGLPPFEVEMRRRVWWLLKTHDFRTAELCGLAKFRDIDAGPESTQWPTNVNDDQIYPGMTSFPPESDTLTDICFVSIRYELAKFAAARVARFREQGKDFSHWELHSSGVDKSEIQEAFKEVEQNIEMKYLRYCDPAQPLHLMTMLLGRSSLNVARFLRNHPRRWASLEQTPIEERQWIWEICMKLLEQHHMVQSNPQLKQFAWHAAYFLQWHSLIHVLDTLRANPLISDANRAWRLIGNTYDNNPAMILDTRKPIHVAVGNICLNAYSARDSAMQSGGASPLPTPEFISQLRHQREVARLKRQARDEKGGQSKELISYHEANLPNIDLRSDVGITYPGEPEHRIQNPPLQLPSITQTNTFTQSDSFWFGFDYGQSGNSNDAMNIDLDSMLAQNFIAEDGTAPSISWEQWDAWLADSNATRLPAREWVAGT